MAGFESVKEHMEVIGADGVHVGTVNRIVGDRIKLVRTESGQGRYERHHHYISGGLVAEVEGDKVRLSANGDVAVTFEVKGSFVFRRRDIAPQQFQWIKGSPA